MDKIIVVDIEKCMACNSCVLACAVAHSQSKELLKAIKEKSKPIPKIILEVIEDTVTPIHCRHCEDAPCLGACITGAMYRNKETGAVLCNEDKCVGCWMCIMVCPFGVISRNIESKKVISKCDLCMGEETPVCVRNCPNEAIICEENK